MGEAGFYGIAAVGGPVGQGVSQSRWATLEGVVKVDVPTAPYTVANEYIAGILGLAAGLPVPPGTIARLDDNSLAYVMLKFGLKGETPPPADASAFVEHRGELAARIAVFDCWILNSDRHNGNFAYIPGESAAIFDHGHAVLGTEPGNGVAFLEARKEIPMWAGAIVPELKSAKHLLQASQRLRSIDDDLIKDACETARRVGAIDAQEAKQARTVLCSRKKLLDHLIEVGHTSFPKIDAKDWGLAGGEQ